MKDILIQRTHTAHLSSDVFLLIAHADQFFKANAVKMCVCVLSYVWLLVTPGTIADQAPLSI